MFTTSRYNLVRFPNPLRKWQLGNLSSITQLFTLYRGELGRRILLGWRWCWRWDPFLQSSEIIFVSFVIFHKKSGKTADRGTVFAVSNDKSNEFFGGSSSTTNIANLSTINASTTTTSAINSSTTTTTICSTTKNSQINGTNNCGGEMFKSSNSMSEKKEKILST